VSRQLLLLRHAKSSWDDPGLADHERPLAPRGERACGLLADHFREIGLAPDLVLCSSAERAVRTLEGVREGLPPNTEVEIDGGIYGAGPSILLRRLRGLDDEIGSAMLVGHNPAIEELALGLAGEGGDAEARGRMESKYPTGGVASLGFDDAWRDLDWGGARLESFVVPKELG
jgi:phosphohistidine phosphatase